IAECSDFQCPFCGQATGVVEQVLKAYPKDVNFAYKQFPLPATMHPDAMSAAKAAVAAGKQGKFWEMHDLLFQNQRELGSDKLRDYAKKIGLDAEKWEKDYHSADVQAQVDKEMAECQAAGVTGTPTFFVNGKRVLNRSFEGFKDMIDASLKDQSGGGRTG